MSQSETSKKLVRLYQHIDSFLVKATRQCFVPFPPCSRFDSNIHSSREVTMNRGVGVQTKNLFIYMCVCVYVCVPKGGTRSSECQGTQKQHINWWCYRNICWKQEFVALLCTPYTKIFHKLALRTQVEICRHNLFLLTSAYSAVPWEKVFVCFAYHLANQTNFEAGHNSSANFVPTRSFFILPISHIQAAT